MPLQSSRPHLGGLTHVDFLRPEVQAALRGRHSQSGPQTSAIARSDFGRQNLGFVLCETVLTSLLSLCSGRLGKQ